MKKLLYLSLILLFTANLMYSQNYKYSVKVYNNKGKPFQGVKIWFVNKTTGEQIVKYTTNHGNANFELNTPGVWALNLIGMHDTRIIKIEEGTIGEGSQTITYDLESILAEQEFKRKRAISTFTYEDQSNLKNKKPSKEQTLVTVYVKGDNGELYEDIPISLVSVEDNIIYTSKTDKSSTAKFLVPNNQMYGIDVENAINFDFTMNFENYTAGSVKLSFKPTDIIEHIENDTITQEMTPEIEATSTRTFVKLRITSDGYNFYKNESVYLSQVNSNMVYKGITDANGEVTFLIPNGNRYMINFEFQHNVDVINLSQSHGRRSMRKQIIYTPLPELEHPEDFIPKPNELFLPGLNSMNNPKEEGVTVRWGNENFNQNTNEAILQTDFFLKGNQKQNTKRSNIAFVIDKSGSMCGENMIEALKHSMIEYVKKLPTQDKITIITFESTAYLESEMKQVAGNTMLIPIIGDIEAGGGTDIYEGIVLGYSELEKHYDKERNNILILFSDGYGSHPIDSVVDFSRSYNEKGIQIAAVGVGEDYNQDLLKQLTEHNGNLFNHVGNGEEISKIFTNELMGLLTPIGTDVKIEIIYNENIKLKKVFDTKTNITQNVATIDIASIYDGFAFSMMASFDIKNPELAVKNNPVKVKISYNDLANKKVEIVKNAELNYDNNNETYKIVIHEELKNSYSIVLMNEAIKEMAEIFEENPKKAKEVLSKSKKTIDEISPDFGIPYVANLYDKIKIYSKAVDNYIKNQKKE